jgi:phage baseplate assembly protein gpV
MTNYNPSVDPANLDTLTGAFRANINKILQSLEMMLPAQVVSVSAGPPLTVVVQPLITMVSTDGTAIARAQVANIPVMQLGGGGIILTFPVQVGDVGWILASDRDISTYKQNGVQSPPNTFRMFSFSDGVFIPAIMRDYTLAAGNPDSATLQSVDGKYSLTLSDTKIVLTSPGASITLNSTGIVVTGPVTFQGPVTIANGLVITGGGVTSTSAINITAPTLNINAPTNQVGLLTVTGNITATGSITPFF